MGRGGNRGKVFFVKIEESQKKGRETLVAGGRLRDQKGLILVGKH